MCIKKEKRRILLAQPCLLKSKILTSIGGSALHNHQLKKKALEINNIENYYSRKKNNKKNFINYWK